MEGGGGVGEARLLRGPIEEAKSKGVVTEKERVYHIGDQ